MKEKNMLPKDAAKALEAEGKKVLTLIIKQTYFDQILAGTKKQEFREVKGTTYKKLVKVDKSGENFLFDENEHLIPIHYDALLLFVGYHSVRDSALVNVKSAEEKFFTDENGEVVKVELDDGTTAYPSQIAYNLGDVLAKDVHPKG